jgi:DNA polymerase-1
VISVAERGSKVLLIDGNGLAYRAFYAMPEMRTSRGEPVNAVLGFTNMLLRLLEDEKPEYVIVTFDKSIPSARLEQYSEYKAQRQKMPESLGFQMALIEDMVEALNIPVTWCPGHEADDCIATVAARARREGLEVAVVSSDIDLIQLVSPGVRVLAMRKGISDIIVYDEATVQERLGLSPGQIPDFKALAGDASDNIPGIAGIGETGAKKLINEYGSLENIIAHVGELPTRQRERVAAEGKLAMKFKGLTKLVTDLPLEFTWDHVRRRPMRLEKLKDLLGRLELKALAKRLLPEEEVPLALISTDLSILKNAHGLSEALATLSKAGEVALHVLTANPAFTLLAASTGDRELVIPFSRPREGFLFADEDAEMPERDSVVSAVQRLLCDDSVTKYIYDVKNFLKVLDCPGDVPRSDFTDVALAAYLLDPGERIGISDACAKLVGQHVSPLPKDAAQLPVESLAPIAAQYVKASLLMGPAALAGLEEAGMTDLFRNLEMPLAFVLRSMEDLGMGLDRRCLSDLSMQMAKLQDSLQSEIWALAGDQFNINSPKQLGDILFERLGLPCAQKTKSGYATGSDVLEALLPHHPVIEKILQYREVAKLRTTYAQALPAAINPATGRLHTTLNQMVTATGRLSSTEPNLQNIPVRSDLGRMIRRAFVSAPGFELLGLDYSQIELRILAHFSGDEAMVKAFEEDLDIHAVTAARIMGVALKEVTSQMRRKAKAVNFGLLYGMSAHGLAQRLGIPRGEAKEYMDGYFSTFPKVVAFLEKVVEKARTSGYVTSLLGRRRNFVDLNSRNFTVRKAAERMALNAPVQGSAADLIKLAMVKVHEIFRGNPEVRMLLQVHDDLLFEVKSGLVEEIEAKIRTIMEGVYPLRVPLRVTSSRGTNWADMKEMA